MKTEPCKGCGKPILWARIVEQDPETGACTDRGMVPLDPRPPCYVVDESSAITRAFRANGAGVLKPDIATGQCFVSHFATCPKAGDFSGNRARSKS